jgi:hypothetical protein
MSKPTGTKEIEGMIRVVVIDIGRIADACEFICL